MATQDIIQNPEPPVSDRTQSNVIVTGQVLDLDTSRYGEGLKVVLCQTLNDDSIEILFETLIDSEGSYYFQFPKSTIAVNASSIDLFVYQGTKQLSLKEEAYVDYSNIEEDSQFLFDLEVYSKPTVYGQLLRKEGMGAAGCLVKLYIKDQEIETSYTDIAGKYTIPYEVPTELEPKSKLINTGIGVRVGFFNNEDLSPSSTSEKYIVPVPEEGNYRMSLATYNSHIDYQKEENLAVSMFIDDIKIEHSKKLTLYYQIVHIDTNGDHAFELRFIKDETDSTVKKFFRVYDENTIVIEKQIEFLGDRRIEYTKIPTDASYVQLPMDDPKIKSLASKVLLKENIIETSKFTDIEADDLKSDQRILEYLKEEILYKESLSPVLYKSDRDIPINFKFTNSTIDLYTKLTARASEMDALQPNESN